MKRPPVFCLGLAQAFAVMVVCAWLGLAVGCRPRPVAGEMTVATPLPVLGVAPAWRLQDLAGREVALSDFKGKVLVLDFWATWCAPCAQEMPHYMELQKKYADKGLMIVGVSLDQAGVERVQGFVDKLKINYPIVMGESEVAAAYAVEFMPTTYLIDRDGRLRHKKVGLVKPEDYERLMTSLLE